MKIMIVAGSICATTLISLAPHEESVEPQDLIAHLSAARKNFEAVQDYTATFYKQQRVRGVLYPEEKILFKFKKPFMVYMKWVGDVHSGREALFIRGQHNDRLLVHLGGLINYLAPAIALHPEGTLAMRGNLRPITRAGLLNGIELLIEVCERARRNGDLSVRALGAGEVGGRPTLRFERTLPKDKGYPAHRTIIDLDRETKFPLSVVSYDWSEELLEKYLFDDLRLNAGLTEKDFDRANREYGFGYVTAPIP